MIKWIILAPFALAITLLCYILNPIVVLFADSDSELHGFLKNFQTWDNSLTPSDIVKIFPEWLSDFWHEHYIETTLELPEYNRIRWVTPCWNDEFNIIDRLRRYVCRTLWLTRNCAYGFFFYPPFGVMPSDLVKDGKWEYNTNKGKLWGEFAYKNSDLAFKVGEYSFYYNIYIGWKLEEGKQSMYAFRPLAFKIEKEA